MICNTSNNNCPCRVIANDDEIFYCNFIERWVELNIQNQVKEADQLVNMVCHEVRDHIHFHHNFVEQKQKQKRKFLEKIKYGEECFCTLESENVIFLEKPVDKYGDVKYRTVNGKINTAPGFCFSIISKGDKTSEYKTKDKIKAEEYSIMARSNGFRVEDERIGDVYILKIYGDNQNTVDEFVTNLNNNLTLDDLYRSLDFFYET